MRSVTARVLCEGLVLLMLANYLSPDTAQAESGPECVRWGCSVKDTETKHTNARRQVSRQSMHRGEAVHIQDHVGAKRRRDAGSSSDAVLRTRIKNYESAVAVYEQDLENRNLCLQGAHIEGCGYPVEPQFGDTALPFLTGTPTGEPNAPPRVVLTPRQVAYIAVARLKLKAPTPGIGPPPSLNRWDMAAVGYPLWLWGQGQTNPAPVSDSVGGLYVSLDAHVSKIVFDMGDGTKVTCRGVGTKWGTWVTPGKKSPSCGHVYTRPSLPKGKYTVTVTTYWSVAWNVTGQTGAIPLVQSAQTTLPVGELQVLVR